jgi:hypothetical protein
MYVKKKSTTPIPTGTDQQGEVYPELGTFSAAGTWQDGNNPDNHSGAVQGQDADHRAQKSCGICVEAGGNEMETLIASYRFNSFGEPFETIEQFARSLGCVCYKP